MTVTEQARQRLYAHLEETMGEEHAAALLEWAPNGPIASKADVEQQFAHLREVMDLRFAAVDARFAAVDKRFDAVDKRFDAVDKRFDAVDKRFDAVDKRFETIDKRFETIDARFETIDARFAAVDKRFETVATKEDLANLRAELHSILRVHTLVIIGAMGTMISIARIF